MKIAIDALPIMSQKTGIGYYTHHLISQFVTIAPDDDFYLCDVLFESPFCTIVKLGNDLSNAYQFIRISKVPFPFVTFTRFLFFIQQKLIGKAPKIEEMDIFFGPNYRGIFKESMRTVITIHDMVHKYFPETIGGENLKYLTNKLPNIAKKAHCVITDSESTKNDIIKLLNVPEEKVKVIYLGVDGVFKPLIDTKALASVKKRYGLPEKFILFLGTIEPRKNIQGLMKAYAKLCEETSFNHDLVLAGDIQWKSGGLKNLIKDLRFVDRVRFIGYVDETDLANLYNLADIFVYPSFYEGFGLPIIEAMACGVPVVTSNTSSLPEIAGNAAVLIDPHSIDDLAQGIKRVLSDNELRQNLIRSGLERAKLFTWEKCAREIMKVFKELLSNRGENIVSDTLVTL